MQVRVVRIGVLLLSLFLGPALKPGPTGLQPTSTAGWTTHASADYVEVLHAQGNTLWAGSRWGGLVGWDVVNETFVQRLYPQDGLAGNYVKAITTAPKGRVWVATTGGVSLFLAGGTPVENFTFKNTSRRLGQRAVVQERAPTGSRYVRLSLSSESDVLSAFAPGYLMFGTDPTIYFYRGWDDTDQAVVIHPELHRTVEAGTPVYAVDIGLAADKVRDVAIDHAGRAWISTVNGVSVYDDGDWAVYTKPYYPLVSNDAGTLAVDGLGRVWISHPELGRFTMFDGGWHPYSLEGTIQDLSVSPSDGRVWAATRPNCDAKGCRGGGVWSFDGAGWRQRYRQVDGIADDKVDFIVFGAGDRLWLGHELVSGVAVSRWTGSGWQVYQSVREAIELDFHGIITTQTSNDLWAVAAGRVWTRHLGAVRGYAPDAGWKALYTGATVLNSNHTRAIAADSAGRVWVGAHPGFDGRNQVGGGVNVWNGEQWTHYTAENSNLVDNRVSNVMVGRDSVWVETLNGFSRFSDGVWSAPVADISEIVENDYPSIIDSQGVAGLNDNRLWTVDDANRVWVWRGTGAKYYQPGTGWVQYTFEDELRRQEPAVTYLQHRAPRRETRVWISAADIPDSAAAQNRFLNGYLMIGDQPTIYRYESFLTHPQAEVNGLQISPALPAEVPAGTPVYAVKLGLLSNVVKDVEVGPDGRIWFANGPGRSGSTDIYGGVSVLDVGSGTWEHYVVSNTGRRGPVVGHVTAEVGLRATRVPADFGSAGAADQALPSGFVMFEGDPTLYRYIGYDADGDALIVRPIFNTPKYSTGVQQTLSEGTLIYAVKLGLLGEPNVGLKADRLAVDSAGQMWIAVQGVGISVFRGPNEWTNYRRADDGLASEQVEGLLARGDEMWVWTDGGGISVYRDGRWQTYDVFNSGLVGNGVDALAITPSGEAWMATHESGISVLTLPGFRLNTSSEGALAQPGGTTRVYFQVAPVGGFSGTVSFLVEELPPGIDATFTPASVDTRGSIELRLDVSELTTPGSYTLTVVGRSPDGLTARRQLTLNVVSSIEHLFLPLLMH